jgi:hypothetical protein
MGRIDKNDITGSVFVRRHPEQTVELLVACLGEGIWRAEVDGSLRPLLPQVPVEKPRDLLKRLLHFRHAVIAIELRVRLAFENLQHGVNASLA